MTTTTHLTQDDLYQIELDQIRKENKKQITKLVNTYCEMHGWGAEDALTECLCQLIEMGGTAAQDIERLNNMNDEYLEEEED